MNIPELYFRDRGEVIKWHQDKIPGSYERYLEIRGKIKSSGFPGSVKLLRNVDSHESVTGFASFVAEMNLANVLLDKKVTGITYEPKSMSTIDFIFDDIAISVKSLHPKNYQKNEQTRIEKMQIEGGGTATFTHKNFSSTRLQVDKIAEDTFGWERTETGHAGFLDSDLDEMSAPLHYMGELEQVKVDERKKVLFFFVQSGEFKHYYIDDIFAWYFGAQNYQHYIFQNDMQWYYKLFRHAEQHSFMAFQLHE